MNFYNFHIFGTIAEYVMAVNMNNCTIATSDDPEDLRQDAVVEAVLVAKALNRYKIHGSI